MIRYWTNVDAGLGGRVAKGIRDEGFDANGAGARNAQPGDLPVGSSASTGL